MNQRATEVTDESEQPENQQHNENSPEHMFSFELVYFASFPGRRVRLKIFGKSSLFPRAGSLWRFKESTGGSDLEGLQRHCRLNLPTYALQISRCFTPRSLFRRWRFWRNRGGETLEASALRRNLRMPGYPLLRFSWADRHLSEGDPGAAAGILDRA